MKHNEQLILAVFTLSFQKEKQDFIHRNNNLAQFLKMNALQHRFSKWYAKKYLRR